VLESVRVHRRTAALEKYAFVRWGLPDRVQLVLRSTRRHCFVRGGGRAQWSQRFTRGAIDFTRWFSVGDGADHVVVSVIDHGGVTRVSDVFPSRDGTASA
jgi:hypothetical protein